MRPAEASAVNTPATLQMLQLAAALRLHPERDLHPSWLPAAWPARHRQLQRLGPAGRAVLADWLRAQTPDVGLDFVAPRRRLLLLDGSALRRIAFYAGLALHAPLLRPRGGLGAQLRRQARRIDRDAQSVVLERLPPLRAFKVDLARLEQRPRGAGRVVLDRGYRLLQGAMAAEGDAWLQRLQRKLPRRAAALRVPALDARQRLELDELMLMGVVPERLPQWDWLF
jgi:type III secretion protein K